MFASVGRGRKELAERELLKNWQHCKYRNFSMENSSEWWAIQLFRARSDFFLSKYLCLSDNGWLLLLDGSCSVLQGWPEVSPAISLLDYKLLCQKLCSLLHPSFSFRPWVCRSIGILSHQHSQARRDWVSSLYGVLPPEMTKTMYFNRPSQ